MAYFPLVGGPFGNECVESHQASTTADDLRLADALLWCALGEFHDGLALVGPQSTSGTNPPSPNQPLRGFAFGDLQTAWSGECGPLSRIVRKDALPVTRERKQWLV